MFLHKNYIFFLIFVVIVLSLTEVLANKGTVNLDEHSFDKIVNKFEVTVVKFDPSYPYGDKHEAFMQVADELKDRPEILFAQVGIKDWGDKENENLGKKYGVNSKADYPALMLFVQGEDQPFGYPNSRPWTVDDIKRFIRDHTSLHIGLPGCLQSFDLLASEFASATDKKGVYQKAQKEHDELKNESEKKTAKYYLTYMKKSLEKKSFVTDEKQRLNKLLESKISKTKKEEISQKINILSTFAAKKTEL